VVGAVEGKVVVMGDDMIVTANTLIAATEALLAAGALEVHAFATHALFADGALARLQASRLAEIVVTDSVRISGPTPSKLTVLSIADVLADTIANVFANRSVSAQFAGQELF
jgi:ribose-phosphate pyrophosphokinase